MRGVNLGGWLVLERWIAPSVFKGTDAKDEYSLMLALGTEEAIRRLAKHRETFITKDHIQRIAELELEVVRVPIGYWLFGGVEPFVDGADAYIDEVFIWAEECGIRVILDFHAAPGSQNGWDHSGRSGEIGWPNNHHVQASLDFIERLSKRFGHHATLYGIEPLNEPHWDIELDTLLDYYRRASEIIERYCHPEIKTIVSDAFRPEEMSRALRSAKLEVMLDVHLYQLFTPEDRALDLKGHIGKTEKEWARTLRRLTKHHRVLVGEWSAAMSELYTELSEKQHNYDSAAYRHYAHIQQHMFSERQAMWTYWTARTEDGGVWSLLDHPELLT